MEYISPHVEALLGYSLHDWYAHPDFWYEIMHADDRARAHADDRERLSNGQNAVNRYRLIARDGRLLWVETRVSVLRDAAGEPCGWRGVAFDVTESMDAQATMRENHDRLQAIVQGSSDVMFLKDTEGRYLLANDAAAAALGRTPGELIGKLPAELFDRENSRLIMESDARIVEHGEALTMENVVPGMQGPRVFATSKLPYRDARGKVEGIIGVAHDVTAYKAALQQINELNRDLQRQVEEFETLIEVLPVGIAITRDPQARHIHHNATLAGWFEMSSEDNASVSAVESPPTHFKLCARGRELRPEELPMQRAAAHGEQILAEEIELRLESGRAYTLLSYAAPFYDETGRPRGAIGAFFDITERQHQEQQQRFIAEADRLLAHSLEYETTLDMVARLAVPDLADCCLVHLLDDAKSIRLLAVAHRDAEQEQLLWDLHRRYPLDLNLTIGIPRVCRTGQSELHTELEENVWTSYARDGEHLRLLRALGFHSALVVPLVARDRILGTVALAYTDSDRRYTARDLALGEKLAGRAALAIDNAKLYLAARLAREDAESANRTKDEFLATLSHELRTPLSAISGWIYLLRQERLDAGTAATALQAIERSAQAQTQLVEDLLDVSRIISGKLRLDLQLQPLTPVVTAAIDAVRPAAQAKAVTLHAELGSAIEPFPFDAQRLQQVVWNLLSNAIKFTPSGGSVTLHLAVEDATVCIEVIDTGIGINADFLPYIFQRFRQADSSTTRSYNGLGLGLALVRHLVEMHGGSVSAQSDGLGRGSRFQVRLPLPARDADPAAPAADGAVDADDLSGLRVLLVDDESDILLVAEAVLAAAGAEVRTADSAVAALATLENWRPDVVVSDIGMPQMDGCDFLRQVRRRDPAQGGRVPAIAMTAYGRTEDLRRTAEAGFQVHLTKPVPPEKLRETVAAVARRT